MDQKSLAKAIAAGEEALAAERDTEAVALANLGQALHSAGKGSDAPDGLVEDVDSAVTEIKELEESLRTLLSEQEERKALSEESRTLKVEARNTGNKLESVYEDLGRAAWDLRKSGKTLEPDLEEALEDLVRVDEKIHNAEVAAYRNESDSSVGSRSILSRGRALFFAGRKKTASASLDRLWSKAGRKIASLDGTTEIGGTGDSPLASAFRNLNDLEQKIREIEDRQEHIASDLEKLDSLLTELPGKGTVRRRQSWLEDAADKARIRLDEAYLNLARGWMENKGSAAVSGNLEKRRKDVLAAEERINTGLSELEAYRAHSQFLKSRDERDRMASKVHRTEQDIKERQAELKLQKKELNSLERELTSLEQSLPPLPAPADPQPSE